MLVAGYCPTNDIPVRTIAGINGATTITCVDHRSISGVDYILFAGYTVATDIIYQTTSSIVGLQTVQGQLLWANEVNIQSDSTFQIQSCYLDNSKVTLLAPSGVTLVWLDLTGALLYSQRLYDTPASSSPTYNSNAYERSVVRIDDNNLMVIFQSGSLSLTNPSSTSIQPYLMWTSLPNPLTPTSSVTSKIYTLNRGYATPNFQIRAATDSSLTNLAVFFTT